MCFHEAEFRALSQQGQIISELMYDRIIHTRRQGDD